MRKLIAGTAVLGTAAALAVPALGASTITATKKNTWSPATKTVAKGAKVTFKWNTGAPHNVIKISGPGGGITSGGLKKKGTFTTPKLKKGTYTFICANGAHPKMRVTVKVK